MRKAWVAVAIAGLVAAGCSSDGSDGAAGTTAPDEAAATTTAPATPEA